MYTAAESLLLYLDAIRPKKVIDLTGYCDDVGKLGARIRTAQALKVKPTMCLRAIVEEWSSERIVRELY